MPTPDPRRAGAESESAPTLTLCDSCGRLTSRPTVIAMSERFSGSAWSVCPRCLALRARAWTPDLTPRPDYRITSPQLSRLAALARRLFTEERMSGDEMRDAAQQLHGIIDAVFDLPIASPEQA